MSKIYFVRHGESQWNVEDKICGQTDIPLTERGHAQAEETGSWKRGSQRRRSFALRFYGQKTPQHIFLR